MAGPPLIGQVMHVKQNRRQMEMRIDAHGTMRMPKEKSGSAVAAVEGTSVLRRNALDDGGKRLLCDLNDQMGFLLRPRERMHTNAMPGHRTLSDRLERATIHVVKEDRVTRVAAKDDVVSRACDVVILRSCHPWSACSSDYLFVSCTD